MFTGQYILLRSLLSGTYSSLHTACHIDTRELVVLKRSRKRSRIVQELLNREHRVLSTLKHSHIRPVLDYFDAVRQGKEGT